MIVDDPRRTIVGDPWLWIAACVGWLVAGSATSLINWAGGVEPSRAFRMGANSSLLGGLVGVCLLIRLRVEIDRRRAAIAERSARADLWDPWLDEESRALSLDPREIAPARAPVRPRVLTREGGSFCLEDEVYAFAKKGAWGAIRVDGLAGSGRSTALRHLLAVLPPELGVRVLDGPDAATLAEESASALVVYAADSPTLAEVLAHHQLVAAGLADAGTDARKLRDLAKDYRHVKSAAASFAKALARSKPLATYLLASWGDDELIEYLLSVASGRCGSVMARLKAADDRSLIGGSPELWRVVLDRMITDESIIGVRQALRRELSSLMIAEDLRERVRLHCLTMLGVPVGSPPSPEERAAWRSVAPTLARLIRHRPVQVMVVADRIARP